MKTWTPLILALSLMLPPNAWSWWGRGPKITWENEFRQIEVLDDCGKLTLWGEVKVMHPARKEAVIECHTIEFKEDAELIARSDLKIKAKVIKGDVRIYGVRTPSLETNLKRAAAEQQYQASYRRDWGARAAAVERTQASGGGTGSHGQNEHFKISWRGVKVTHPTPGGRGGDGGGGAHGITGYPGMHGHNGLDGVNITIEVQKLKSLATFVVTAPGEDGFAGGKGQRGQNGRPGGPGGQGGNGGSGKRFSHSRPGGDGGNGGRGGNGGDGGIGGNGGDGGQGGNISVIYTGKLKKLDDVELQLSSRGGEGGEAGPGGDPGQAGPGGAPGKCGPSGDGSWLHPSRGSCVSGARFGSAGSPGSTGNPGAPGQQGNPGAMNYPKMFVQVDGQLEPFPYEN